MKSPLPSLLLWALASTSPVGADFSTELAGAVRAYYDLGPEQAIPPLIVLAEQRPEHDDVAWWLARCELDAGRASAALELLGGRVGENIPVWRFQALSARAALLVGDGTLALSEAVEAVRSMTDGRDEVRLREETRMILAALAYRGGDRATALEQLSALPADCSPLDLAPEVVLALPELDWIMAAELAEGIRLPEPLRFQARGTWWTLPAAGGLATRSDGPSCAVCECPGPDLCTDAGEPLLGEPSPRFSPSLRAGRLWYGAGSEPLARGSDLPGIFTWSGVPGDAPVRSTTPPSAALDTDPEPAPSGELFFLRRHAGVTRLFRQSAGEEPVPVAPDLQAVASMVLLGDVIVVSAVLEGVSSLRWLPVDAPPEQPSIPLFEPDFEAWSPSLARDERW